MTSEIHDIIPTPEERTVLNGQLQETLKRHRTAVQDFQNVLYSTDVAIIFLDKYLDIRFFTPAAGSLFNLVAGDIGRPLADLKTTDIDNTLGADVRAVLRTRAPLDRAVETAGGLWYQRRILPCRSPDQNVEGVILTFTDISKRRHMAVAREVSPSTTASAAELRFLAAATHDLKQPLQTITLLQSRLSRTVQGERARMLVSRLEDAVGAMSTMIGAMLDIYRIEAGVVQVSVTDFDVADMMALLKAEFADHAQGERVAFHGFDHALHVRSDLHLLAQILRNMTSDALKYSDSGKVIIGCRRRGESLSLEVWDSLTLDAEGDAAAIFKNQHPDRSAHQQGQDVGLVLSIVNRLADLLGHEVSERTVTALGAVFSIDVPIVEQARVVLEAPVQPLATTGSILIIEGDAEARDLLERSLRDAGHQTTSTSDGLTALKLAADGMARPDLILADFDRFSGLDGVQATFRLRHAYRHPIPAVIFTDDMSPESLDRITGHDCVPLDRSEEMDALPGLIARWLPAPPGPDRAKGADFDMGKSIVYVVDDEAQIRGVMRELLEDDGRVVLDFASCAEFLEAYQPGKHACLLVDARMPGMSGLDLLRHLQSMNDNLPAIMITGAGDLSTAVSAMKAGARDFLEKPVAGDDLLSGVERALDQSRDAAKRAAWRTEAAARVADLTERQLEIMELVLAGHPSKNIAADLGISQRTVETHRAAIMQKTGAGSLPALARLVMAARTSPAG